MIISYPPKKLCPFLIEPFENCYCSRMDSQDIERAVNLCSHNFEICDIYRKHDGNGKDKKVPDGNGNNGSKSKHIIS